MNGGYQSKLKSVRRETCLNGFQRERHECKGQSRSVTMANCGPSHGLLFHNSVMGRVAHYPGDMALPLKLEMPNPVAPKWSNYFGAGFEKGPPKLTAIAPQSSVCCLTCSQYMHMLRANKLGAFAVLLADTLENAYGSLSPSAASLLLTLFYGRDATATALAKVAGVSQPTAVRVLDGLVRQGFIERKNRTGRTTLLCVTRAGRERARLLQAARLGAMETILSGLNARERATFERMLDTILGAATTSRALARTICRLCDHPACDGPLCPVGTRASEIETNRRHSNL